MKMATGMSRVRLGVSLATIALLLAGCAAPEAAPTAPPTQAASTTAPATATTAAPTAAVSAASAGNVILSKVPNAPPRPAPTPLPSGVTAPPAPTAPPAKVVPLYWNWDTVTAGPGESKYSVDASLSCVKSSVFTRGMHIVWRMEFIDTTTGKILQGTDIRTATLKVDSDEVKANFGRHGALATSPWFWTAAWDVPPTHALGKLSWSVQVVTTSGKEATFTDDRAVGSDALSNAVWIIQ